MIRNLAIATVSFAGGVMLMSLASAIAGQPHPVVKARTPALPVVQPATPKPAILQKPSESRAFSG